MRKKSPISIVISFIAIVILVYTLGLNNGEITPKTIVDKIGNIANVESSLSKEISPANSIDENGTYTDKENVALYIKSYGKLPKNFITKKEAMAKGWNSEENYLGKVLPNMSIGGDYFGNYEEKLPVKKGRKYYECDIDYKGKSRNSKRIVFSNDGLIYYTEDHYNSFEDISNGGK